MSPAFPSGPQAALVRFAIRFRGIVAALACVLVAYGVYALGRAKYDVFPEFAAPQVEIQTEAAGLAPEPADTPPGLSCKRSAGPPLEPSASAAGTLTAS